MSVRRLPGYVYEHIPSYGKGTCALCHYGPNVRCQARREGRRTARNRIGVVLCGSCWEDTPAGELTDFIERELKTEINRLVNLPKPGSERDAEIWNNPRGRAMNSLGKHIERIDKAIHRAWQGGVQGGDSARVAGHLIAEAVLYLAKSVALCAQAMEQEREETES